MLSISAREERVAQSFVQKPIPTAADLTFWRINQRVGIASERSVQIENEPAFWGLWYRANAGPPHPVLSPKHLVFIQSSGDVLTYIGCHHWITVLVSKKQQLL